MMIDILKIDDHLWVLEEDGQNVFLKDCLEYGVSKSDRKSLFLVLSSVVDAMKNNESLTPFVQSGMLKKLDRQPKARQNQLWEIRNEGRGVRLIFVREDPDLVIVSAVSKFRGSLSQAINRGANRWARYQKERKE